MLRLAYVPLVTLVFACGSPDPSPVGETRRTLVGVPQNGYPTYDERLQLVSQNRARSDPNYDHPTNDDLDTMGSCSDPLPARPPLDYHLDLSEAARFHCRHSLLNDGGLTHDSYCTLLSTVEGCDGSAACSCMPATECWTCTSLGGCGTDPFTRMGYFGFTGNAENGAANYADSWDAVLAWITECPPQDGHRINVNRAGSNVVGTGSALGNGTCWDRFFFSDYGNDSGRPIPRIPSGAHRPENGSASTTFTVYANWYDESAGDDPLSIDAVIDGICYPMAVELGATGNRTYQYATTLPAGCREYYILARDSGGTRVTYPEVGSLLIEISGGAPCASDYAATQLPASCETATDGGMADSGTAVDGGIGADGGGMADSGVPPDSGVTLDAMADSGSGGDVAVDGPLPDTGSTPDVGNAETAPSPDEGALDPDSGSNADPDQGLGSDDADSDGDGGVEPEGKGGCSCDMGQKPAATGWLLTLFSLLLAGRFTLARRQHADDVSKA